MQRIRKVLGVLDQERVVGGWGAGQRLNIRTKVFLAALFIRVLRGLCQELRIETNTYIFLLLYRDDLQSCLLCIGKPRGTVQYPGLVIAGSVSTSGLAGAMGGSGYRNPGTEKAIQTRSLTKSRDL